MTGLDAVDDRFPIFELGYGDSEGQDATYVRSRNGILFARAANGGSFRWISLRLISSAVPLRMSYTCRYLRPGDDGALTAEAPEGERCPPEDAGAITQLAFRSKIYYRCRVARTGRPGEETAGSRQQLLVPQRPVLRDHRARRLDHRPRDQDAADLRGVAHRVHLISQ